jgi:hypothetical protein
MKVALVLMNLSALVAVIAPNYLVDGKKSGTATMRLRPH